MKYTYKGQFYKGAKHGFGTLEDEKGISTYQQYDFQSE